MKGIQKLFLGLFLMALISVGFKVDVKAAKATAPTVTHTISTGGNVDFSFTAPTTAFPTVSGTNNATFTYTCDLYVTGVTNPVATVIVKLVNTGGTLTYYYDSGAGEVGPEDGSAGATVNVTTLITKLVLEGKIKNLTESEIYIDAEINGVYEGNPTNEVCEHDTTTPEFAAGKVTIEATYSDASGAKEFPPEAKKVVFSPKSPFYLIEGQSVAAPGIEITTLPGTGYKYIWTANGVETTTAALPLTMDGAAVSVKAEFSPDDDAVDIDFTGMKVLSGNKSYARPYALDPYTYKQIKYIKIGDSTNVKEIRYPSAGLHSGTIQIVAPDVSSALTGKMWIGMDDGLEFDAGEVTVLPSVTFTLPSSQSFVPNNGGVDNVTPTYNVKPSSVSYSLSPSTLFSVSTSAATDWKAKVTTTSTTGTGTLSATAVFNDIEEDGKKVNKEVKASTAVSVESLTIKDAVYVNKGLSILLSKFIKSGSSSAETQVTQYPDLIKIDPTSGKVNGIKISGESAGTKDDSLVVSTQTGKIDVTVYPSPTLSVETSTSGPYKYTVKVPKGLYHDDVFVSEVSKAVLEFKAIDHDDKTKKVTIDSLSDDSDNKLLKKGTKSIELKDLNKYIKDIAKDTDTQTIQVRAYAYNKDKDEKDDKVYSEKKEFTVYKINLDTSGNASYTVNGENVGGYFYGISDATYTIKSSATNGGKLDTTKSGDFNSGESISYKVLGARTLKAVYTAGGANANTTGGAAGAGMDGYDDVPKTGESRTDIWILWSVLLVSILGAGFMIWKRFGLVRAIAAADEEMAQAQEKERVEAEKKAEKDKMDMLKDLRNL